MNASQDAFELESTDDLLEPALELEPATTDHRTASQIDRESRGMVLFCGQEITREAYNRLRQTDEEA